MQGTIVKVSGPLIVASGMADVQMFDVVRVSEQQLIGEIIELRNDRASIQVYEETGGIGPGEPVFTTGAPLSVELGPGLIESIYDGIQRPLTKIREQAGDRIPRGVMVDALDHEKLWAFTPVAKVGDELTAGDVLGTVQETEIVTHKIMVPPGVSGRLTWIFEGEANIVTPIAKLEKDGKEVELPMLQRWPVRRGRPYKEKLPPTEPMVTGQRVIDTLFPVAKGGVAAVPGPFGSGQDRGPAPAGQVVRRGHHRLRGLRRARQRDDRRAHGVPGAEGPQDGSFPDEADHPHRQHLGHARGRP